MLFLLPLLGIGVAATAVASTVKRHSIEEWLRENKGYLILHVFSGLVSYSYYITGAFAGHILSQSLPCTVTISRVGLLYHRLNRPEYIDQTGLGWEHTHRTVN